MSLPGLRPSTRRPSIPGGPRNVAEVLDRPLADRPDDEFLVGRSGRYTFREFERRANQAANALAVLGVQPGDRVAASLPNDTDLVTVFHGTLRLGAIWIGLNRALAPPEKAFLLADAGVSVLVAEPAVAEVVGSVARDVPSLRHVVVADRDAPSCEWRQTLDDAPGDQVACDVDPHAPAAIAYTSGTTGRPKGVVHSQHNLLVPGAVQVAARHYDSKLRKGDCFPLTVLNMQVLTSLLVAQAGGCSIVMDRVDSQGIAQWVRRESVGVLTAAPAMLFDLVNDDGIDPADLATVTELLWGGSDCAPALHKRFRERFGIEIKGTYGLTEAPTTVTAEAPGPGTFVAGASGKALPHLEVVIRGDDGASLPAATMGEICVRPASSGPWAGVYTPMLGYLDHPDATAEALDGDLLRTGDIGYLDTEGNLFVRDRRKLVIVRGGANVYPAEVERVLYTDDRVLACAVVGVPDDRLGERVGAYVQLRDGQAATEEELLAHCAAALARYKVPERICFLAEIPRNAMGKIQRDRLHGLSFT